MKLAKCCCLVWLGHKSERQQKMQFEIETHRRSQPKQQQQQQRAKGDEEEDEEEQQFVVKL